MNIKIDKSLFTAEERAQYEALIAKATVDPASAEEEMDEEVKAEKKKRPARFEIEAESVDEDGEDFEEEKVVEAEMDKSNCKKSASPEIAKALDRLTKLEKSLEMNTFTEIAKKYAALGEDEEELAKTLYNMNKSNKANYDAYIDVLDKSLNLVEKSGIFAEIGKSGAAYGSTYDTVDKIEGIASELRKSNPEMGYAQSIAKAWDENPELIAEYDKAYRK